MNEIPRSQKRPVAKLLEYYRQCIDGRNEAIVAAYGSGGDSRQQVAEHFGLNCSSVSRIIKIAEPAQFKT